MADNQLLGITDSLFGVKPKTFESDFAAALPAFKGMSATDIGTAATYAGAKQAGRGLMQMAGIEDPEMASANRAKQFANELSQQGISMQSSQGMKALAQKLSQAGDFKAAQAASALAMNFEEKEASIGFKQAQTVKALREPKDTLNERLLSSGKYTPASIAKYIESNNPADLVLVKGAAGAGDGGPVGLGKPTAGQKAVDTKFAKEYSDYYAGGGIANLNKNLEELDRAISIIENSKEGETSGRLVGVADKTGTLPFTHRKASDVKDIIGGVAQSNLRQILGGQFAQKEGEALLARQYDTAQSKDNNLARLRALRTQAANAIASKSAAADYYEEFGTLQGFKATKSTASAQPKTKTLKSGKVVTIEE